MSRRLLVALALITVAAAVLRMWGIAHQVPTPDDLGVGYTAGNWVLHGQPYPSLPFHPHLRDFLEYCTLALFGKGAWGLKLPSMLLGTLSVPLLGLMVWRMSRNEMAAIAASVLLAVDGVHVDYSRQAIQEVQASFFLLLGAYLVVEALVRGHSRSWRWLLPAAGVAFGLGTASKFYAIPALVVSIALVVGEAWKRRHLDDAVFGVTALGVVAFGVYVLTFAPWFGRGYGVFDWIAYQRGMLEAMVTHTRSYAFTLYPEPAQWFVQPFTGYADLAVDPAGSPHLAIATGNPLVWLAVLPAAAYSLWLKRARRSHQIVQAYFWAGYLPLALSARPVWVLSSVAVLPFAFALVALVAADIGRRFGARIVIGYLAVAVVTSLALYPLATGDALKYAYLRPVVERMGSYGSDQGGAMR